MARRSGAVFVCLLLQCAAASAYPDLDWKLYDGVDAAANGSVCFYEERSIVRTRSSVVRVWTKCVVRRALDTAGAEHLNALFSPAVNDMAISRRTYGYVLPILSTETLSKKAISAAIRDEAVADVGGVAPETTTLHEIDCKLRRTRVIDGTTGNHPLPPSGWAALPAKSPADRLRRILCP